MSQKCQPCYTLPNQSQGANGNAQKCHSLLAPTSFYGAAQGPQKCQPVGAPLGGSQYWPTEMSLEGRSPQPITGGQIYHAEMPRWLRPHQFTGCHIGYAEMLLKVRTKGKGHLRDAKMPRSGRPSRSITGGQVDHAAMP